MSDNIRAAFVKQILIKNPTRYQFIIWIKLGKYYDKKLNAIHKLKIIGVLQIYLESVAVIIINNNVYNRVQGNIIFIIWTSFHTYLLGHSWTRWGLKVPQDTRIPGVVGTRNYELPQFLDPEQILANHVNIRPAAGINPATNCVSLKHSPPRGRQPR